MYQYYIQVESEEHFLNASEIALKYGIMSTSDIPHSKLVRRLLIEESKSKSIPAVFYETKKGLMRVFSFYLYDTVMKEFLKKDAMLDGEIKKIEISEADKQVSFVYKIKNI